MKRLLCLILLSVLLFGLAGCADTPEEDLSQSDGSTGFSTDLIDVDGGDAILVRTGGRVMLIDAGYEETADRLVTYLKDAGITAVDYLLITHFDKDHIGGVPTLINSLTVKNVLQPVYEHSDTKVYARYASAISKSGIRVTDVTAAVKLKLGGCEFEIYPATGSDYAEADNDYSLVTKVSYGETSFLFAGDVEADRLAEMIRADADWSATVLKYPHHGSFNKRTETFLKLVDASFVLISDSSAEPASDKLMSFLEKRSVNVLRNGTDGTVRLISDGTNVEVLS